MDYLKEDHLKNCKGTKSNLSFNSFGNINKFPALRALEKKFKKKHYLKNDAFNTLKLNLFFYL